MSDLVVIGGDSYRIYGTAVGADKYWKGALGAIADAWAASVTAVDDKRKKAENQAAKLIDRQAWIDAAITFDLRDTIPQIVDASYEIAGQLLVNPTFFTATTSGSNIKRVSPGRGVEVEFFNPTLGITGQFPIEIQELLGPWLAGSVGGLYSGSYASGTNNDADSAFGNDPGVGDFDLSKSIG